RQYIFNVIPITMIYFLIIWLLIYLMLRFTKFGRNIYIIGSNIDAANSAGIPTKRVQFFTFIISGVMAAISGIILSSQLGMAHGEFGSGYEFQILTICILGGISLSGGRGTLVGVLIATLLLGSISNGLALSDVSKTWLDAIYGAILIIAILIDSLRTNRRKVVLNE
ncbi:MAG: ABC transporter permease, partial [Actinobacteria bacterium]|nr:ABC transporter permease [Actinomycetota bacterium]